MKNFIKTLALAILLGMAITSSFSDTTLTNTSDALFCSTPAGQDPPPPIGGGPLA